MAHKSMGATRVAAFALLLCAVARGQSCGSIDLSGSSASLAVSPPMKFEGDFTVECWAKLTTIGNSAPFSIIEPSSNYAYYVYMLVTEFTVFRKYTVGNEPRVIHDTRWPVVPLRDDPCRIHSLAFH